MLDAAFETMETATFETSLGATDELGNDSAKRTTALRERQHAGVVVWFTGLPSSGKSSLAERVQARLSEPCCLLDGDRLRKIIHANAGYSASDRDEFYTTLGALAAELARQGLVVLVAATARRRAHRQHARTHAPHFMEVWLDSGLDECRKRDAKGLYAGFARGSVRDLPGEDVEYEAPESPDVRATGARDEAALQLIVHRLEERNRVRTACIDG